MSQPLPLGEAGEARIARSGGGRFTGSDSALTPTLSQGERESSAAIIRPRGRSATASGLSQVGDRHVIRSTTVLAVRRDGAVAMGADGQVTVGELVMKASARKVRRLYHDQVLVGFSGATADAFALFERFERQLEHYHGNTRRAAVELAREWRGDRLLRE